MTDTLLYASHPTQRRWSLMGMIALGIAAFQIPMLLAPLYLLRNASVPGEVTVFWLIFSLIITPLVGMMIGATSAIRVWTSDGLLRGGWIGGLAAAAAIAWPIYVVVYALQHLPNC